MTASATGSVTHIRLCEILASVLIDKFLCHVPLYRRHQRLLAAWVDVLQCIDRHPAFKVHLMVPSTDHWFLACHFED